MCTGEQVKVETDVNVTSPGNDDVGRDVMEACASQVNASLQRVDLLEKVLAEQWSVSGQSTSRPLTVIDQTVDCPSARMTPAGFLYLSSGWQYLQGHSEDVVCSFTVNCHYLANTHHTT